MRTKGKIILFVTIICMFMILSTSCGSEQQASENKLENLIEVEFGEDVNELIKQELIKEHEDSLKDNEDLEVEEEPIKESLLVCETIKEIEMETIGIEITEIPKFVSLGEFKLTAYCSCSLCCGTYAFNRPIDENGNEIVYGSIGERLIAGVSIAVDPHIIPYKTEVVIGEHTYIAHDTGGAIDGNRIDIYFDNHQEALNFGVQYAEVYKVVK